MPNRSRIPQPLVFPELCDPHRPLLKLRNKPFTPYPRKPRTLPNLAHRSSSPQFHNPVLPNLPNQLNPGAHKKRADARDFRKFTLDAAKARNLKMGVINENVTKQRPFSTAMQIIEALRVKNALNTAGVPDLKVDKKSEVLTPPPPPPPVVILIPPSSTGKSMAKVK